MAKRSPYRARIGGAVDREKEGPGWGSQEGFYGVRGALDLPGISEKFLQFFL